MKGLKRPDLSLSDAKAPDFLADVYYDLRDRRLLPLLALVVVAIAAVPFLLGDDVEPPVGPVPPAAGPDSAAAAGTSSLAVVEATPGLREYRKRLKGRTPTDPFIQRFRGLPPETELEVVETELPQDPGGGGPELSVDVTEVDTGPSSPESTPPRGDGGGSGPPNRGSGTSEPGSPDGLRLFGYRPDVRFGVAGTEELKTHEELPLGSLLPKKKPVVLFVGITQDGKRALFSVTPEITRVRGEGGCVGGKTNCMVLSLREGQAADLLTGLGGPVYRLKVAKIEFIELDLPRKGASASARRTGFGLSQDFSK